MFHPALFTVNLTGNGKLIVFSGRRFPFFSTTLPMLIRPSTGGVITKPLIMGISSSLNEIKKCNKKIP
jgi:hypothetical protein